MNEHGHEFGHEFMSESLFAADSDIRFFEQSHGFGYGHKFGHGHILKPRIWTPTRTNIGHACPLISDWSQIVD